MSSITIQAVRGMNDILPADAGKWRFFEDTVDMWLKSYGYQQIRLPIVEKTELFARSIGEITDIVEKEMYSFVDQLNGESLTLRPEGTASCVRAVIEHSLLYAGPQRLYYQGPMFRHERPQKGRYRQFHQVGVEALGFAGPDIDAEHIIMTARLWRMLQIGEVRLELNTLGSNEARSRYRTRLINYFERHERELDEDAKRRLHKNPLRILDSKNPRTQQIVEAAPKLLDDLDEEALQHFEKLQALLRHAGVSFTINTKLVRGLDYYNYTVFEWITDRLGAQGTVCAGGRYDGLVEQIGGKPAPACGFAMGVERLLSLIEESNSLSSAPDAYLVHQGSDAEVYAWVVAERLRDERLHIIMHAGGGSFKSQMKKADSSGARYALIIGDDEARVRRVSVKPLREAADQRLLDLDELISLLKLSDRTSHV